MNPLDPLLSPRTPKDALAIAAAAIAAEPVPTGVKRIRVKLFHPGNKKFVRKTFVAGAGRVFSEEGIDSALDFVADQVEKIFPGHDYEMVQIAPDSFNCVWRRDRNAEKALLASALLAQRREAA